jgi:hypothetical protein
MLDLVIGAAVEVAANDDRREWAVQRPSRSVAVVRSASRVPARWQRFHDCVVQRESGGSPSARNPRSSAQGLYQFLDRSWRPGLSHMVAERLRDNGASRAQAKAVRSWLAGREIATWPAVYQTVGFVEVVTRGGSFHWRLAGSRCEAYR